MDNIATAAAVPNKPGFFKHIFNENTQNELLNIIQYALLAVIPLIIITRNINFFFPSIDKTKGNIELVAEALGQLSLTVVIVLFLHRILTYFTPWGGGSIPAINFPTFIMLFLVISIGYGLGHIGEKIEFVWERLLPAPRANFWDADTVANYVRKAKKKASVVRVTQPYAQLPPPIPTQQMGSTDYITTQKQLTPPLAPPMSTVGQIPQQMGGNPQYNSGGNQQYSSMGQYTQSLDEATIAQNAESQGKSQQNFNQMYSTGNAGGGGGGGETFQEPMAANSVLGGFTPF